MFSMYISHPVHLDEQIPANNQHSIWFGIVKSSIISEPEGAYRSSGRLVYLLNAFPSDLYPTLGLLQ